MLIGGMTYYLDPQLKDASGGRRGVDGKDRRERRRVCWTL
jgi:hypothetical protein